MPHYGIDEQQPTKRMAIDIVSDVVCPWCPIGFLRLERALERLSLEADYRWHPFELNLQMPPEGQDLHEHIRDKYGTTAEQSRGWRARMEQMGRELGFVYRYDDTLRIYNSFRAHQLGHWAAEHGKQTPLELALFAAYFSEQQNIDDPQLLIATASSVGLDADLARAVLEDARYAPTIRQQEQVWLERGIHAVPTFVIDGASMIAGAHDVEVFVDALRARLERDG